MDKSNWPRCLLWHGWLPALSGSAFGNPWAEDAARTAKNQLETAPGSSVDGLHSGERASDCIVLSRVLFSRLSGLRFGGVLIDLQGHTAMHIGVDNLNVVNHVSSLIANRWSGRPFPLVNDVDFLRLTQCLVQGQGSCR